MHSISPLPGRAGDDSLRGKSLIEYVRASGRRPEITPNLALIARALSPILLGSASEFANAKGAVARGQCVKRGLEDIAKSSQARQAITQLTVADMRSALAPFAKHGHGVRMNAVAWATIIIAAAVAALSDPSVAPLAGLGGAAGIVDQVTWSAELLAELGAGAAGAAGAGAEKVAEVGLLARVAAAFGSLAAASPGMAVCVVVVVVLIAVVAFNAATGLFW